MKQIKDNTKVASPCVDKCCLNQEDICMGCFRTLDEILQWGNADTLQRMEILQQVRNRKESIDT